MTVEAAGCNKVRNDFQTIRAINLKVGMHNHLKSNKIMEFAMVIGNFPHLVTPLWQAETMRVLIIQNSVKQVLNDVYKYFVH